MRTAVLATLLFGGIPASLFPQTDAVPGLKPGENSAILFAAKASPSATDQNGDPIPQQIEPIAFIVRGQLRQCDSSTSEKDSAAAKSAVLTQLQQAYTTGRRYPLWRGGGQWGQAEVVKSCIDADVNLLAACVQLKARAAQIAPRSSFRGIAFSGPPPISSHSSAISKAGKPDKNAFIAGVSRIFRDERINVPKARIAAHEVWKTQLRPDHRAISGSALAQIPGRKAGTYRSYRVFAVLEEDNGQYNPVLRSIHNTTIEFDKTSRAQESGELEEGEDTDREEFFDSFPLFPGEPDAVITEHTYYEGWNFSIYRWKDGLYRRVYTGCGGGL